MSNWIPVSERVPEQYERVIGFFKEAETPDARIQVFLTGLDRFSAL